MANGNRAVESLAGKQVRNRGTNNIGPANDNTMLTRSLYSEAFQQGANTHRSGWNKTILAQNHTADIDWCKTINILIGRYGIDYSLLIDMLRQGQLHDEAIYIRVIVEEINGL